jgi:predicted small lipoprotein YifL
VFVAAGCGQSGPLYVPGNPSRISNPPPPAEEGEEGEEGEDENDSEKQ